MQILAFLIGVIFVLLLPAGFSDNFAGFVMSFLGIFIGLFTSIIIAIHDRSSTLFEGYEEKDQLKKVNIKKVRNYLVQFTGLTSYAILIALLATILLSFVLLRDVFKTDIFIYSMVNSPEEINVESILCFLKVSGLILHRFFIVYLLTIFFSITIYATTSYFSYLLEEYSNLKTDKKDEEG